LNATLEEMNHKELVLGTKYRSGDQWDIWQAFYSPVGADGYPKPTWDKLNGEIDRSVAEYRRENYDLGHMLKRDWAKLGPKLEGKIRIYCGDMDNYYLNNARLPRRGVFEDDDQSVLCGRGGPTATAPNIVGTEIPLCRMRSPDCAITRCTYPRFLTVSRIPRQQVRIRPAGNTDDKLKGLEFKL
jgi:hypothetical protein